MRVEFDLPQEVYVKAREAAQGTGVSLENFVLEAIQGYLAEPLQTSRLTPQQVKVIRKGQEEIRAGKFKTSQQVEADHKARRDECLAANPH